MYLLIIHIPVFKDGNRYFTDINWKRDLMLGRDWLARPFGELVLLSPSLPMSEVDEKVMSLAPIGHVDGIRVVPSFDPRCRTRHFWLKQRKQWMVDLRREIPLADVVHAGANNVLQPLGFLAHDVAVKSGVTTVFIGPDMDPHVTQLGVKNQLLCLAFDYFMRCSVRSADLCLLKEGLVYDRYARFGSNSNVKAFCHSMHSSVDVIDDLRLKNRLSSLESGRRLRAVYAGRFVARKGLKDAISAIALAKQQGLNIEYHLFGNGPEEEILRRQTEDLGIRDLVRFRGFVEYDSSFLASLAEFDILLFMPTSEDTPRMLYDAMAAGLPVVGSSIPFLSHRIKTDNNGLLVQVGDSVAAASNLKRLDSEPGLLESLSWHAQDAGRRHSIEEWYRKRLEWTQQAVSQHANAKSG